MLKFKFDWRRKRDFGGIRLTEFHGGFYFPSVLCGRSCGYFNDLNLILDKFEQQWIAYTTSTPHTGTAADATTAVCIAAGTDTESTAPGVIITGGATLGPTTAAAAHYSAAVDISCTQADGALSAATCVAADISALRGAAHGSTLLQSIGHGNAQQCSNIYNTRSASDNTGTAAGSVTGYSHPPDTTNGRPQLYTEFNNAPPVSCGDNIDQQTNNAEIQNTFVGSPVVVGNAQSADNMMMSQNAEYGATGMDCTGTGTFDEATGIDPNNSTTQQLYDEASWRRVGSFNFMADLFVGLEFSYILALAELEDENDVFHILSGVITAMLREQVIADDVPNVPKHRLRMVALLRRTGVVYLLYLLYNAQYPTKGQHIKEETAKVDESYKRKFCVSIESLRVLLDLELTLKSSGVLPEARYVLRAVLRDCVRWTAQEGPQYLYQDRYGAPIAVATDRVDQAKIENGVGIRDLDRDGAAPALASAAQQLLTAAAERSELITPGTTGTDDFVQTANDIAAATTQLAMRLSSSRTVGASL